MKRGLILAMAIGLVSARCGWGVDYDWTNGAGNGLWADGTNWTPAGVPDAGDNLVLTSDLIGGPQTIDLAGPRRIGRVEGQTLSGVYTFTNSGAGSLEIGAPDGIGVVLSQNTPGWVVFESNLVLAASGEVQFQTQSPSSRIIVNGNISSSAAGGMTTLNLTSANMNLVNVIEVNGIISDGANARMALTAGDAAHADLQRGQVLVSGLNTYSGPTSVNGMTLAFNSIGDYGPGAAASALGAPQTLADGTIILGSNTFGIVNQAGTLRYVGTAAAGHSSNRPIRFVGLSPGGTIEASGAGPLVLSGGVSSTASTDISRTLILGGSNTGNNTFAGVIEEVPDTAVQSLMKTGPGKWILSAANTYVGTTTIFDGTLVIGPGGSIGSSLAPTFGITVLGSGVLRIDGGSITTNNINRPSDSAIDFRSGSVTLVGPGSSGTGPSAAVLDIGTAGAGILNVKGGSLTALNINVNGVDDEVNVTGGALVTNNLDNSHGGTLTVGAGGLIRLNAASGGITTTNGSIGGNVNGPGGITKVGAGVLQVSGVLSYNGPTNLNEGTLRTTGAGKLSSFSAIQIAAGAVLELDSAATVASLGGQGQIKLNNADLIVGGGGTFSGSIQDSGNLVTMGGTLTLLGNNSYTGSADVEGGTLVISSIGSVGTGPIKIGNGIVRYAGAGAAVDRQIILSLAGGIATIDSSGTGPLVLNGGIDSSTGAQTLTLAGNNTGDNTIASPISNAFGGNLMLVKSGTAKWILSGSNTYTGATVINGGELVVSGPAGKIGGGNITISQNGVLTLDGGTVSVPSIQAIGSFRFRSGTLNLGNLNSAFPGGNLVIGTNGPCALNVTGGTNTFGTVVIAGPDDSLTLSGGTNFFTSIDNSHGGTFNFLGGTLTIGGDLIVTSGTISSNLGGSSGLTKTGSGTVTITSIGSSYTGATHVQEGRLIIGGLLPDLTMVSVDAGATLEYAAGGDDAIFGLSGPGSVINNRMLIIGGNTNPSGGSVGTFSGTMSGSGTLAKSGNGVFTFAGNSTASGPLQVTGGAMVVSGAVAGISGFSVGNSSSLNVSGHLSTSGVGQVLNGTLTVDGGQVEIAGPLNSTTTTSILKLNSGSITASQLVLAVNNSPYSSTFTWAAGAIHLTGPNGVTISKVTSGGESGTLLGSPDRPFKNALTLDASKALIIDQTTTVGSGGTLTIGGGSLTTKALSVNSAGAFNLFSGTLHFTQGMTFDSAFLGLTHLDTIAAGKNLIIDGAATINAPMALAGGNMVVDTLVNPQNLTFNGGTISIRQGNLDVRAANFLSLSRGSVANVGGSLNIASTGEIDAIGATLNITGASTNAGQINAINSTLNFAGGLGGGGQVNLINSTVSTSGGPVAGASVAAAGASVLQGRLSGGSVNVTTGSLTIAPGSGTSDVGALSVAAGAEINASDNGLVIRSGDLAAISAQIRAGLSGAGGIVGSSGDPNIRLGAIANGVSGSPIYTEFEGVTLLGGGEILLRPTIVGDLNLDGMVSISDLEDLAANLDKPNATWAMGDVNYDGVVSISDFIDLAAHFGQTMGAPVVGAPMVESVAGSTVPEPGILVMMISSMQLLGRRRRAESGTICGGGGA